MREISCGEITECICKMCIQAAHFLSPDMEDILQQAKEKEIAPLGKQILQQLQDIVSDPAHLFAVIPHVDIKIGFPLREIHIAGSIFP